MFSHYNHSLIPTPKSPGLSLILLYSLGNACVHPIYIQLISLSTPVQTVQLNILEKNTHHFKYDHKDQVSF